MTAKKNDKYKKKYLLKQIEGIWGYYECEGNYMLVKNCILKEKYNKIYQLIFHGGDTIDGLYLINGYDVDVYYKNEKKVYRILNNKYDKIAGCDDFTAQSFKTNKDLTDWLISKGFLFEDELKYVNATKVNKDYVKDMIQFSLEG